MISLLLPTMYQRMNQAGSLDLNVRREVEGKGGQVDIAPDQRLGLKSTHTELRDSALGLKAQTTHLRVSTPCQLCNLRKLTDFHGPRFPHL